MKSQRYDYKHTNHRRPTVAVWLVILGVVLLHSGTALGQGRDDVRAQLERTDELIESARDIISEAGSVGGSTVLDQAIRNQQSAWQSFDRGHWGSALKMTERARDEIYRALGNIRQSESNESEVEQQLERTDVVLGEFKDRVGVTPTLRARRVLEMASTTQRRAWDLYRERTLRPALRLTLEARQMLLRSAIDAIGGHDRDQLDDATFNTRHEQLTQALKRVEGRLGDQDNAAAQQHLETAHRLLDEANDAFADNDSRRTDRLLKDARRELEQAMRLVIVDARGNEVAVLIESAEDRLDLLRAPVMESGDSQVQTWFDQASQSLVLAREALTLGRNQRALYQTRNAVELLNRIADELQP